MCSQFMMHGQKNIKKFDIYVFFLKSVEKIEVSSKYDKNNGYVT